MSDSSRGAGARSARAPRDTAGRPGPSSSGLAASGLAWLAALAVPMAAGLAIGCAGAGSYRTLDRELTALETGPPPPDERPFPGAPVLEREALVAEVLRRNPTIAAARFAWRAALARYPQETALDDPTFGYSLAPRTIGSSTVPQEAHRFDVSQAFPFPGKLALRGAVALAEAEAAAHDYEAVRLRLAAMASLLYDEYWLVDRQRAINGEHLALVRELRAIATARYESGVAEQQDPLRAEVAEAGLLHRAVVLDSAREVTAQQLALLLHRRSGSELPPPPVALAPVEMEPPEADVERALAARPELAAANARIEARRAAQRLARLDYFPDFRLEGVYDRGWDTTDMRPMVGLEIDVPLQLGRRRAAVEQARAELERARRERESTCDEIAAELETARARYEAAHHGLEIARDRLLPAASDQLEAARSGFEAGRVDFADVIDAERALRDAELGVEEAEAESSRRAAEWLAASGRLPGLPGFTPANTIAAPTAQGGTR